MLSGIALWNFISENKEMEDVIGFFASNGFNSVSFKPENILDLSSVQLRSVMKLMRDRNLQATVHAKPRHSAKQLEYIVNRFGGSLKCITIDPDRHIDPEADFFKELDIKEHMNYLLDASNNRDILFGFEDFPLDKKAIENNYDQINVLLESRHFGILLDLGHSNLRINDNEYFNAKGLSKYVSDIPVKIVELHIHDNNGKADQHMPPGLGNLDYDAVIEGLKCRPFSGICTIEVSPKLYNSTPDREREPTINGLLYWKDKLNKHDFIRLCTSSAE